MTKITNTRKDDAHPEWVGGGNPAAIEAQEARGQAELVSSSQLPADGLSSEKCARYGIKDHGSSKGDELFHDVTLPAGWRLVRTEHPMWSELHDEKGQVVAEIFYKAAYYDRRAHLHWTEDKCQPPK